MELADALTVIGSLDLDPLERDPMSIAVIILALAIGCYAVAVLEGWAVHGRLSLTRPATSALALLGREQILPRTSDRLFFEVGPVLLLVAGLLSVAVIPLA